MTAAGSDAAADDDDDDVDDVLVRWMRTAVSLALQLQSYRRSP